MKLKFLTVLAIAGMAIAGCGSGKNEDGTTDSAVVDTSMTAPATDTANLSSDSTMADTTTTKPVDSATR